MAFSLHGNSKSLNDLRDQVRDCFTTVNGRDLQEMTLLSIICTLKRGNTIAHPAVHA